MADMQELLRDTDTVIAVVGANNNAEKYGGRIYRDLKHKGFTVYPVNPNADEVDGDRAYASLSDLPEAPDVVDYVVPGPVTRKVLEEAKELGYMRAFVQPGADNPEVQDYLRDEGFDHLVGGPCIMVETRALSV